MKRKLVAISLALFMVLSVCMLPLAPKASAAEDPSSDMTWWAEEQENLPGSGFATESSDLFAEDSDLFAEDSDLFPEDSDLFPEDSDLFPEDSDLFPEDSDWFPEDVVEEEGRQNNYPIVLVHGLFGFGRDEGAGIRYWGFQNDIQDYLNAEGYKTYTVGIGPVSSNWDRACEMYAQIKGGTVDYGAAHSARCNHERYGRTYPGFYKDWGEMDADGQVNKIHMIGHSMGGQTIRVLPDLLVEGSAEERAFGQENMSPLFEGGKDWVSGVMAISAPQDGTSADTMEAKGAPHLQQILAMMAAMLPANNGIYDFKLDQWGLSRKSGETCEQYSERVFASDMWNKNHDFANWDLLVAGAKELNEWVNAQPNVYYFSWTTKATRTNLFNREVPLLTMNPGMLPISLHICNYTRSAKPDTEMEQDAIGPEWHPNDGMVPVISQNRPHLGSSDQDVDYNGTPQAGVWNNLGVMDGWDHGDIIGMATVWDPRPWYKEQAELLGSLPK